MYETCISTFYLQISITSFSTIDDLQQKSSGMVYKQPSTFPHLSTTPSDVVSSIYSLLSPIFSLTRQRIHHCSPGQILTTLKRIAQLLLPEREYRSPYPDKHQHATLAEIRPENIICNTIQSVPPASINRNWLHNMFSMTETIFLLFNHGGATTT